MKVLWICGLPSEVQREVLHGVDYGSNAAWSWIMGHLPPPPGIELHIACRTARHTAPQEFDYRGARFHLVPVQTRARVVCLFELDSWYFEKLHRDLQPDVVHGWGTEDGYALTAIKLAPVRSVVQVQGCINTYLERVPMHWLMQFAAFNERRVLRRAHHVVAENQYALNSALPWIRTRSAHVVEHPLRDAFHTEPPAAGTGKQVVYVGSLTERKGLWDTLEAFATGVPGDWSLVVIGEGSAETTSQMHARLESLGIKNRVRHHPTLDARGVVAEMRQSSIFLLPTRIDTGPTSLKEAMAMGLWPICYDNSGPAHYIRHFGYGALATDLDLPCLTKTLQREIASETWNRPEQREKIENLIRPSFHRRRIWNDLLRLYDFIIADQP